LNALFLKTKHPNDDELVDAMERWASGLGFKVPGFGSNVYSGQDKWASLMAWTKGRVGYIKGEEKEDGVGNERITAYAVRSPLSRYLCGEDTSYHVVFRRPLPKDLKQLDDETKKSIVTAVNKLKLPKKDRTHFAISVPKGAAGGWESLRMISSGAGTLGKSLGFTGGCSTSLRYAR
jgi:hypothetical protein